MQVHLQTNAPRHTHIYIYIYISYTCISILYLCAHRFTDGNADYIPISYLNGVFVTSRKLQLQLSSFSVTPLTRSGLLYQLYWKMGMGSRVDVL